MARVARFFHVLEAFDAFIDSIESSQFYRNSRRELSGVSGREMSKVVTGQMKGSGPCGTYN